MFGVDTQTFKIDLVWEATGVKDMQFYLVEIVPDLKI